MQKNIAVIGAGPKAAAIAAKAYCFQQDGIPINVEVFEKSKIGANWSGGFGYTDGVQRLCTPAERDLGYPYLTTFGQEIEDRMFREFSWHAFLSGENTEKGDYSDWVNRGRLPATHQQFTNYLQYGFARAGVEPRIGGVTEILLRDGKWDVVQMQECGDEVLEFSGFDGLVFTGPGPARQMDNTPQDDPRIFDGLDFWTRLDEVKALVAELPEETPVVIIGGGGTAAAIAAWFLRNGYRDQQILLLNSQAMLFTRTNNFFENRLFDDDETWKSLSYRNKVEFTQRLNRGVVWETVTSLLSDADNIKLEAGTATAVRPGVLESEESVDDLYVEYANERPENGPVQAGIVIQAMGFGTWDFVDLLPDPIQQEIEARRNEGAEEWKRDTLFLENVRGDLSLPLDAVPPLHVPNLAAVHGPGLGSLMSLGSMADRVLSSYVDEII